VYEDADSAGEGSKEGYALIAKVLEVFCGLCCRHEGGEGVNVGKLRKINIVTRNIEYHPLIIKYFTP
jgi:hypothetical protein